MTDLVAFAPSLDLKGLRNCNAFAGAEAIPLATPLRALKVLFMILGIRSPILLNIPLIPLPTAEKASLIGLVNLPNSAFPDSTAFRNLGLINSSAFEKLYIDFRTRLRFSFTNLRAPIIFSIFLTKNTAIVPNIKLLKNLAKLN